jgi:hypothetical protein
MTAAIGADYMRIRSPGEALRGSRDRAGVVNPASGGWLGEGICEAAPRHRDVEQLKGASSLFDDDGVFADRDAGDLAGGDFDLRGRDHLVRALDAGNAAAHQLRGAQAGNHDELERIRAVRTLNHETCFFLAALVRLGLE